MALQYSVAVRDAQNDQLETTVGSAPKLQLRSGAPPANCAAADSGTLLAELTLPADWLTASSSGQKQKNGTWSGAGSAAGTIGHFRVKDSGGSITHMQGTVTLTGGGGDMTVDNTSIAVSQSITVNTFNLTRANA
ncbi:MAG: hypothetical protein ACRC2G_13790, partial [Aestuariivirga sp.]